MSQEFVPPGICPVCGEEVARRAKACPECGADARSGWRTTALASDGLDLPDAEFDYDEFVAEEFGACPKKSRLSLLWIAAGVLLLLVFVLVYFTRL